MVDKNSEFPVYRKLPGAIRLYKIESAQYFIEKQRIGTQVSEFKIVAKQYPEMLRIQDMINLQGFERATCDDWNSF